MTEPPAIDGHALIAWGHAPGPWFAQALPVLETARAQGVDEKGLQALARALAPPKHPPRPLAPAGETPCHVSLDAETADEAANRAKVIESMEALLRTPTLVAGAVMPDACPSGPGGTIPVGGVAAAKGAIHPGLHSADICCSVAITVLAEADPRAALDAASAVTHFGGGGRQRGQQIRPPTEVMEGFAANPILARLQSTAIEHFATQGDGNHFFYVGRLASTGQTALVTHHGSRKPGAMLYKRGMELAEAHRRRVSPETQKINAWIEAESDEGRAYWDALQTMRAWTKANHFALHDRVMEALSARAVDRFWNEHNFVFRRGDVYLHGKGATPAWSDYAEDASGEVLIPLNMAEPVLIARGRDADHGLGFCPHGAGRDFSRSEHQRRMAGIPVEELVARETQGIDARFHCGRPDASELPSAYKRADHVVAQIERFGLAEIVDRVEPFGCIMAGDWTKRFRDARAAKRARREAGKAEVEAQAEEGASG